jgi:hypothetical protein
MVVGPIRQEFVALSVPTASSQQLDDNLHFLGLMPSMHGAVACAATQPVESCRHGGVCLSQCMHGTEAKAAELRAPFPRALNRVCLNSLQAMCNMT